MAKKIFALVKVVKKFHVPRLLKNEALYTITLVAVLGILEISITQHERILQDAEYIFLNSSVQMSSANAAYAGAFARGTLFSMGLQNCRGNESQDCKIMRDSYLSPVIGVSQSILEGERNIWKSVDYWEKSRDAYLSTKGAFEPRILLLEIIQRAILMIMLVYGIYRAAKPKILTSGNKS